MTLAVEIAYLDSKSNSQRRATERKQAEEALSKSEARFRAFVTASSDMVYNMSPDWSEMRHLRGREFIPDTNSPNRTWLEKYRVDSIRERAHLLGSTCSI